MIKVYLIFKRMGISVRLYSGALPGGGGRRKKVDT